MQESEVLAQGGQIALMQPLHDDHNRPGLLVVEPRGEGLAEIAERGFALGIAFGLERVVQVIDDDRSPPFPVTDPPVDVAIITPRFVFWNSPLTF